VKTAPVRGVKLGPSWGNGAGGPRRSATANHIQGAAAVQYCSLVLISNRGESTERPSVASHALALIGRHLDSPQNLDSPAAFLESLQGLSEGAARGFGPGVFQVSAVTTAILANHIPPMKPPRANNSGMYVSQCKLRAFFVKPSLL
jgi:hypothetical protein